MDTQALSGVFTHLPSIVTAIGGLGTASYGLVDVTKSIGGGVSNRGFGTIAKTMATLVPETASGATPAGATAALSLSSILTTLRSNWINGMGSDDQRNIAKSLVKLRLNADIAPLLANVTGVDPAILASVAAKIGGGTPLSKDEADTYARFDLILTTLLDQAYQQADQQYRNTAKLLAVFAAVALAVVGAYSLGQVRQFFLLDPAFWQAVLMGLLASPVAPVAKDIASAVQAGTKVAQAWGS